MTASSDGCPESCPSDSPSPIARLARASLFVFAMGFLLAGACARGRDEATPTPTPIPRVVLSSTEASLIFTPLVSNAAKAVADGQELVVTTGAMTTATDPTTGASVVELPIALPAGKALSSFTDAASGVTLQDRVLTIPMKDVTGKPTFFVEATVQTVEGTGTSAKMVLGDITLKSAPLQADLSSVRPEVGKVGGAIQVALNKLPTEASVKVEIMSAPSETMRQRIDSAFTATGRAVKDVAYTLEVTKTGLVDGMLGPALVTMTVSAAWVDQHGGPSGMQMVRVREDGSSQVFQAKAVGTNAKGDSVFETSWTGLSDFALTASTVSQSPSATPGNLDPTFSVGGIAALDFKRGWRDQANAIAIQRDGKIVVTGCAENCGEGGLARFNADGSLDITFGTSGLVKTDYQLLYNPAAIVVQPDGKLLATGCVSNWCTAFALARYNQDGSLDSTFGSGGLVNTSMGIGSASPAGMALQLDGKIVVVGCVKGCSDFGLARYNTNGSLDTTFGSGGKVVTDLLNADDANAVVIQPDGKIVVAGCAQDCTSFALARYTSSGSRDTTFGEDGITTTLFNGKSEAFAVTLQLDGKIVVAGCGEYCGSGSEFGDFAVARYNSNGSLDTTFGTGGKVTTNFDGFDTAYAVAIQADGKILVAGVVQYNSSFGLVRYDAGGNLDQSFGTGGKVVTYLGNQSVPKAMALQPDAKVVLAGCINNCYDFAVARYLLGTIVPAPTPVPNTGGGPIAPGETKTAAIDIQGDDDDWNFRGTAGQIVTIRVNKAESSLDPLLELLAPSGDVEKSDDDSGGSSNSLIQDWILRQTGTYIIRAKAYNNSSIGAYTVSLAVISPAMPTPTPTPIPTPTPTPTPRPTPTPTATLISRADVTIAITKVGSFPVTPRSSVAYAVTVQNRGPGTANDMVITGSFLGQTLRSASGAPCSFSAGTLRCNLGTMASGGVVVVSVVMDHIASAGQTLTGAVAVHSTAADPAPANNWAEVTVNVSPP